jgi:hypothetical protein
MNFTQRNLVIIYMTVYQVYIDLVYGLQMMFINNISR